MSMLTIFTDGGARGNPGPAAIGVVFKMDDWQHSWGAVIGVATNNVAEYQAVSLALDKILSVLPEKAITALHFNLDSELVVKQLNGLYRVKEPTLQNLCLEVKRKLQKAGIPYSFHHIPRAQNAQADKLVNQVLDEQAA